MALAYDCGKGVVDEAFDSLPPNEQEVLKKAGEEIGRAFRMCIPVWRHISNPNDPAGYGVAHAVPRTPHNEIVVQMF